MAALEQAIENLQVLVRGDGADLTFVAFEPETNTLRLSLSMSQETCADCVMPAASLEAVALQVIRRTVPSVVAVTISDPRDGRAPMASLDRSISTGRDSFA